MITPDSLACRRWSSEHIRAYAMALARHDTADTQALLASLEPLHCIAEDSPAGALLWCAYNVACDLPDVAERAMMLARVKWPEAPI